MVPLLLCCSRQWTQIRDMEQRIESISYCNFLILINAPRAKLNRIQKESCAKMHVALCNFHVAQPPFLPFKRTKVFLLKSSVRLKRAEIAVSLLKRTKNRTKLHFLYWNELKLHSLYCELKSHFSYWTKQKLHFFLYQNGNRGGFSAQPAVHRMQNKPNPYKQAQITRCHL